MPRSPEYGRQPEPEPTPLPYYLASRFPTKQAAQQPYMQAQETIREMDCNLSTYRFLVPQQTTQPWPWYVVTIGEIPPEEINQRMTDILSQGELTTLPDKAIRELYERRLQQIKKGSWVEAHYKPTIKKKEKRNQQKQSRRRNRWR